MGRSLPNSGGLGDEIRVAVFPAPSEPHQSRRRRPNQGDSFAAAWLSRPPADRAAVALGQAVTGGLLFWRGRRLREVLSAPVVDAGLRPRFFSVFPTPANFRSR
jgi:hypothetical protein